MFASFELAPQGLDLFFEEPCPLTHAIDTADVSFKVLIDMYLSVKLEFLEIFNQFHLLLVILDTIK